MKTYHVEVFIKPWEEGGYLAEVPSLQGCWCLVKPRQTFQKALEDIQEVVEMHIQGRQKMGWLLPAESKGDEELQIVLRISPLKAAL